MPEEKLLYEKFTEIISLVFTVVLTISLGIFVVYDSVIKKFASQLDTYNLQPDKKARLHLLVFTYEKPNKAEKKLAILKENLFTEIFSNALEIRTICLSD